MRSLAIYVAFCIVVASQAKMGSLIGGKTGASDEIGESTNSKLKAPQMVSLFPPSEVLYDRYAAAIAATEPLRVSRDREVMSALPLIAKFFSKKESGGNGLCTSRNCDKYPEVQRACLKHVADSSRVIRALGMTVAQFNDVSRKLGENELLRERVMEQAYLYRVASSLSLSKLPLVEDPASSKLVAAHARRQMQSFARSLTTIESLRSSQTELLKRTLNVRRLPTNFKVCDPDVLPFLSPKIQAVCNQFPILAEEVVKEYGLNSEEFNRMMEETKRNPMFRWRVNRYVKRIKGLGGAGGLGDEE
ncbi:hypothetical protein TrRE_jg6160 [Triparma retinervis]|uniref:DUF4168 domain-containing protein n=1 Tax=Triparma retinervis TaxID=2557542 RepID=A0A9W7E1Z9_9STRA|nr:hypothetical protein TrRE_jg6160 [Triparma retinervis]